MNSTKVFSFLLFAAASSMAQTTTAPKAAEPATRAANAAVLRSLPALDLAVEADISHGFVGSIPDAETRAADGHIVYTLKGYEALQSAQAPDTVNPSLWIQARKSMSNGLYRVTDGFYQVRGLDLTNMTIVEGKTGLIIIDPMLSAETARAGLDLYYAHRPRKPVVAVIYNHSHVDHYGGVKGIVSAEDVKAGRVQIVAPAHFMEHAVAENVLAGNAMSRRSEYQFGTILPRGERGQLDLGGAKALSNGSITLIAPTVEVSKPTETITIDGVEIVNLLTPGTEAPAEMVHYFPQYRVLDTGELALQSQHQLLTLRGAEIRNGLAWSKYLNETLQKFGDGTDILVSQHTWPVFGHERVVNYLSKQRDLYKWIHDQTVRLMNKGLKPVEIAEALRASEPASLANEWFTQGYYGSVQRNVKAVYQQYMGWYDSNPAHLDALSEVDYGRRFVEYGGGAENVIKRAHADFARGEYRWVAQAMSHVVFAEPDNAAARELGADALEQLGYQALSAVERNSYLAGAMELRSGGKKTPPTLRTASLDTIHALSIDDIFDFFGVRLNATKAEGKRLRVNWVFTDSGKRYLLNLENSALSFMPDKNDPAADVTLTLNRATLDAILAQQLAPAQAMAQGKIQVAGNPQAFAAMLGMLDDFRPDFEIVMPLTELK